MVENNNGSFAFGIEVDFENGKAEVSRNIFNHYVPDEVVIMQLRSYLRKLELNYYRKYDFGS